MENIMMTSIRRAFATGVLAASATLLGGTSIAGQAAPVLVSTSWLAEHLHDGDLVLLHVAMPRDGSMPTELIEGARFLDYHGIAAMERDGLSVELLPVEDMVDALRNVGVSDASRIVLYGSPGHMPARAYVTLDYLGLGDRTSVLDGGLVMWKAEGRPVASEPAAGESGDFTPDVQHDVLVTAEWIAERLDDERVTLIDARPEDEYTGERRPRELRPGHIPGAYNLFWPELQVSEDEPVLRPIEEARARFVEAGATEGGAVVSYCYVGMRASYTYLISKHLGYDARFYDGSWNEWGQRTDLPAVEGKSRR
jgi:thiosulfate/3-mercaptopyruvate sulfurtransferase